MELARIIDLKKLTARKSAFLIGPRGTGKSFWIQKSLSKCIYINLLIARERSRFINDPSLLQDVATKATSDCLIVIDEIQLVPDLLNEVHQIIEERQQRFLLTGSSARKLKRADANMLGGRAIKMDMFPLTWKELSEANQFDLERYLLYGGLPRVYLDHYELDELSDYVDTYLDQEIKAEAITRNIQGFQKFLHHVALHSGETLVYTNIASDVQVSSPTVRTYVEVLEDTLIGFSLKPWSSPKRKAIQSSRFYIFDLGLRWFLSEVETIPEQSDLFGRAFEQFIVMEVRARETYLRTRRKLYFWRTTNKDEVDLIIGKEVAVEIKSKTRTSMKDARGLLKIRDEGFSGRLMVISRDEINRKKNDIEFLHWKQFLTDLWNSDS